MRRWRARQHSAVSSAANGTSLSCSDCQPPLCLLKCLLIILTVMWGVGSVQCKAGGIIHRKLHIVICIFPSVITLCFIHSYTAAAGVCSHEYCPKLDSLTRSTLAPFLQWLTGRAKSGLLSGAWDFCTVEGASQFFGTASNPSKYTSAAYLARKAAVFKETLLMRMCNRSLLRPHLLDIYLDIQPVQTFMNWKSG